MALLYSFMWMYNARALEIDLVKSVYKVRDRKQTSNDNQTVAEPEQPETPRGDLDRFNQEPAQLRKRDVQRIIVQMMDQVPLTIPFCNCGKKNKRLQKFEARAAASLESHLDIQTIIKAQLRLERIIKVLFGSK